MSFISAEEARENCETAAIRRDKEHKERVVAQLDRLRTRLADAIKQESERGMRGCIIDTSDDYRVQIPLAMILTIVNVLTALGYQAGTDEDARRIAVQWDENYDNIEGRTLIKRANDWARF